MNIRHKLNLNIVNFKSSTLFINFIRNCYLKANNLKFAYP